MENFAVIFIVFFALSYGLNRGLKALNAAAAAKRAREAQMAQVAYPTMPGPGAQMPYAPPYGPPPGVATSQTPPPRTGV